MYSTRILILKQDDELLNLRNDVIFQSHIIVRKLGETHEEGYVILKNRYGKQGDVLDFNGLMNIIGDRIKK